MTKPWEETWEEFEANKGFAAFAAKVGEHEVRVFESMSGEDDDIARAKLAAAAPEMARLLRELHAEHGDRHTFDWAYWFTEIEAVLRKAGAL